VGAVGWVDVVVEELAEQLAVFGGEEALEVPAAEGGGEGEVAGLVGALGVGVGELVVGPAGPVGDGSFVGFEGELGGEVGEDLGVALEEVGAFVAGGACDGGDVGDRGRAVGEGVGELGVVVGDAAGGDEAGDLAAGGVGGARQPGGGRARGEVAPGARRLEAAEGQDLGGLGHLDRLGQGHHVVGRRAATGGGIASHLSGGERQHGHGVDAGERLGQPGLEWIVV
jgi:hypothetical protein